MSLKGKKIYHAKRAGVAILRLDKIEFKQKITWAPPPKKTFYNEGSVDPFGKNHKYKNICT